MDIIRARAGGLGGSVELEPLEDGRIELEGAGIDTGCLLDGLPQGLFVQEPLGG